MQNSYGKPSLTQLGSFQDLTAGRRGSYMDRGGLNMMNPRGSGSGSN